MVENMDKHRSSLPKTEQASDLSFARSKMLQISFIAVALIISITAATKSYQSSQNIVRHEVEKVAIEKSHFIEKSFSWHLQVLYTLEAFYQASSWISPDEFRTFTEPFLTKHISYDMLGWIPVIRPGEDQETLARLQDELLIPSIQPYIKGAPIFYPLAYVEPRRNNEDCIGHDTTHDPLFSAALQTAVNEARIVAFLGTLFSGADNKVTDHCHKPKNGYEQLTFIVPVFHYEEGLPSLKARKKAIRSFYFSVLDIENVVEAAILPTGEDILDLTVTDTSPAGKETVLYTTILNYDSTPLALKELRKNTYRHIKKMNMAGHELTSIFTPTEKLLDQKIYEKATLTFILFLSASLMLFFYIRHLATHADNMKDAQNKAEKTTDIQRDFLTNMSHELRTPMTGILGLAEILKKSDSHDTHDEEFHGTIDAIHRSAESLLMILNTILDLSKIEAGEVEIVEKPFQPEKLFRKIGDIIKPQTSRKGLNFETKISPSIPAWIIGDEMRIQQILVNLVGNAVKFTDTAGDVTLTATWAENDDGSAELVLTIKDTGVGIPEEFQDQIFNQFSQADTSISRKYGGTGLGLAITKNLVDMMKGKISFSSHEKIGTTFTITLPSQKETNHAQETKNPENLTAPSLSINFSALNVLIVEDHEINQMLVFKWLKKIGFQAIDIANNGREALEYIQDHDYDIILMDCQMPELDGYKTTQIIRDTERNTDKHVPIIAMTANAMVGEKEKCLKIGMDDYLSKPMTFDEVKEALHRQLGGKHGGDKDDTADNTDSQSKNEPHEEELLPVDLNRLLEFVEGKNVMNANVVKIFFKTGKEAVDILTENCTDSANENWDSVAHSLKGASGSFGATRLYHLCLKAEEISEQSTEQKQALVHDIQAEMDVIYDYLNSVQL